VTVRALGVMAQRADTPRLVLRRPQRGDAAAMAGLLNDWDVARWLAQVPFPYTERDARDWIAQCARNWNRGINYQFAVALRDGDGVSGSGGRVIGHIGLRRGSDDLTAGSAELGYWFGRDHWGAGYGTEAGRAAIGFGFEELGLVRIWATALPDNDRSLGVLRKSGMVPVGTTMQTYATRNATLEVPVLAIDRGGWRAAAGPAVR